MENWNKTIDFKRLKKLKDEQNKLENDLVELINKKINLVLDVDKKMDKIRDLLSQVDSDIRNLTT